MRLLSFVNNMKDSRLKYKRSGTKVIYPSSMHKSLCLTLHEVQRIYRITISLKWINGRNLKNVQSYKSCTRRTVSFSWNRNKKGKQLLPFFIYLFNHPGYIPGFSVRHAQDIPSLLQIRDLQVVGSWVLKLF